MQSRTKSNRQSTNRNYETPIPTYETALGCIGVDKGDVRIGIPIEVRERHLTKETDTAYLQAIGTELQIVIRSERDDLLIRCPLHEWCQTDVHQRSITNGNGWYISVGYFEEVLDITKVEEDRSYAVSARIAEIDDLLGANPP